MPTLYPLQACAVRQFMQRVNDAPGRYCFGWGTGCGKTAAALSAAEEIGAARVLVIAPAIVRRHWLREVDRWAPSYAGRAAAIEVGRKRRLPKAAAARRDAAYAARLQVVSYDLLSHVDAQGWGLIIIDELHHIAQPLAKQSRLVASLVGANSNAHILGLTATPFPTEVKQIWNPLRLLYGESNWGRASRTGDISWEFAREYCHLEKNEYGTAIVGSRADRRESLRARLQDNINFLNRSDLRSDLPPLDLQLMELNADAGAGLVEEIVAWVQEKLAEGVQRIVVLTHYRATARAVFHSPAMLGMNTAYLDGTMPAGQRDGELTRVERSEDATVLIGTHGALAEGVRLMWAEEVLVCEWPMSPGRMVQILGRFQSVGSAAAPHVSLATSEKEWGRSQALLERVQAMVGICGPSPTADTLSTLLADKEVAGDELRGLMEGMLADVRDPDLWADIPTPTTDL